MPQPRKRVASDGKPRSCLVQITAPLAAFLYRETPIRGFPDETALVNDIVRHWVEGLPPVDWPALREQIQGSPAAAS